MKINYFKRKRLGVIEIPTQDGPEHQTVTQDGADHDEAEGEGPHCPGHFSLRIAQSCVVHRRELSPASLFMREEIKLTCYSHCRTSYDIIVIIIILIKHGSKLLAIK